MTSSPKLVGRNQGLGEGVTGDLTVTSLASPGLTHHPGARRLPARERGTDGALPDRRPAFPSRIRRGPCGLCGRAPHQISRTMSCSPSGPRNAHGGHGGYGGAATASRRVPTICPATSSSAIPNTEKPSAVHKRWGWRAHIPPRSGSSSGPPTTAASSTPSCPGRHRLHAQLGVRHPARPRGGHASARGMGAPIWIVTHVDLHRTPKVQAFLTYLKARCPDMGFRLRPSAPRRPPPPVPAPENARRPRDRQVPPVRRTASRPPPPAGFRARACTMDPAPALLLDQPAAVRTRRCFEIAASDISNGAATSVTAMSSSQQQWRASPAVSDRPAPRRWCRENRSSPGHERPRG